MMTSDDLDLDLLGSAGAAGLARSLITQRLVKWRYPHLNDDALLIASEMITNAAQAAPNTLIRFRLGRNTLGVFLAAWDSSPALPRAKAVTDLTLDGLDATAE